MTQQEACTLKSSGRFSVKGRPKRRVFTGYGQPAGSPSQYPGLKCPVSFFAGRSRKSPNTSGLGLDEVPPGNLTATARSQIAARLLLAN
jgi:hypothetical protein